MIYSIRPHFLANDSVTEVGVYLRMTQNGHLSLGISGVESGSTKGYFINYFPQKKKIIVYT